MSIQPDIAIWEWSDIAAWFVGYRPATLDIRIPADQDGAAELANAVLELRHGAPLADAPVRDLMWELLDDLRR